jgi:large subunit ribosomal protein L19
MSVERGRSCHDYGAIIRDLNVAAARRAARKEMTMSSSPIIDRLLAKTRRTDIPSFKPGDTVRVHVKIKEGDKERLQAFEGLVISKSAGSQPSFTVRKMSFGQGVERIFPTNSKVIDKIEVLRSAHVRRAKLYYLRALRGKAARLREVDTARS